MRPRVFPAEDTWEGEQTLVVYFNASMRPRVFPAEDGDYDRAMRSVSALQ